MHTPQTCAIFTIIFYLIFYILCYKHKEALALVKFTNLKCTTLNKSFADFRTCRLKVLSRDTVALNIHVELHIIPVYNVSLNIYILKKASGYRPFLYNYTIDFCEFMRNRKRQPFIYLVYQVIAKDTNINHSCPYNHDIIASPIILKDENFRLFPIPAGEYMLGLKVGAYNVWRADVFVYFIKEDKSH